MRALFALALVLAPATYAHADTVTLTDGRRLDATLTLDEGGRPRFAAADGSAIDPDRVQYIRFAPATPTPFRAGLVHQVLLTGGQRVTGELLGLDDKELRLRAPWHDKLAVPRGALVGVTNLPGQLPVCHENFEGGLKAWRLTGAPRLTEERTSGGHGLLFDAPGQSAAYAPRAPLEAGSAGVNFRVPESAAGARWQVEAVFGGTDSPRVVRVTVADATAAYAVTAPAPRDAGVNALRRPGWHRLAVEFAAARLLVTVDDAVLWYSREKGPGGPLHEVRLTCFADTGPVRGAVAFDEFTLTRRVDRLRRPDAAPAQDEAWLASGDQVFGRLTRLDRRGVELEGRFGPRAWSWAEVRGAFPRRTDQPAPAGGGSVRVWLRPAAGDEPDELEGVLRGLDERRLTLRHPDLGDLEIDRGRLLRLRPSSAAAQR